MSVATSISENHFLCFVSPSSDSMQFRSPPPWNSWYNWFKKNCSPTVLCRVLATSRCLWDSTNRVLVTGHSRACQCASTVSEMEREGTCEEEVEEEGFEFCWVTNLATLEGWLPACPDSTRNLQSSNSHKTLHSVTVTYSTAGWYKIVLKVV